MASVHDVCESVEDMDSELPPNSVLGKAQLLLRAFESGAYQLQLSELSRRSGLPKASAYRLAQELVQWGLFERNGNSYQLGMRIFELGQRVPVSAELRSAARPMLMDLYAATRATIHLAVLDGSHVLYLEKIAGQASIHSHSQVGGRLPAFCTATGKVLLATSSVGAEQVRRSVEAGLPRVTSRTVATHEELCRQLTEIRARGYALEIEEIKPKFGSLAVPIIDPATGSAYAALSATDSASRLVVRTLLPQLSAAAGAIARSMANVSRLRTPRGV